MRGNMNWDDLWPLLLNGTLETLYMVALATLFTVLIGLPVGGLLIALIPFTRLLIGTTLGSTAAVVPITIGAFPFFARLTESALDEVESGRSEAILVMGGNAWHVISKALLPEALPALLSATTLTIVMLIGFSSIAGVISGGGLIDLAQQILSNKLSFFHRAATAPWLISRAYQATLKR